MAYIGKEPADSFISFAKQDFSTSATTSYTLDNAVTNENELALFINFVRQEPTTAYTASGTTLTLTSATASTDDMYCVYLGKAVQTVNPPSGSVGSSQVAASIITGQTAETSIATDDTVLIHDTSAGALRKMTRANFVSGVGGTNTPAFEAVLSSDFNITDQTYQKIPFATEVFDTAGAFDSSTNYRFTVPSGQAGKYYFYAQLDHQGTAMTANWTIFKKNGNYIRGSHFDADNVTYNSQRLTGILDLAESDYVEVWGYNDTTSGTNSVAKSFTIDSAETFTTFFGGYKIIE